FGWMWFQQKFFPSPPPAAPGVTAPATPTPATPAAPSTPMATGTKEAAPSATPPAARPPEERVTIERPGYYRATFSSWGAVPTEFVLLHPQYKITVDGHDVPINLVRPEAEALPYATSFSSGGDESARSEFDLP